MSQSIYLPPRRSLLAIYAKWFLLLLLLLAPYYFYRWMVSVAVEYYPWPAQPSAEQKK